MIFSPSIPTHYPNCWSLGFVKLEFCENKKLKTRFHQHTFAFPCCCEMKDCFQFWHDVNILWREVGDIEIAFHKLFFPFGSRPFNSQVVFPGEYIFKKDVKNVRNGRSLGCHLYFLSFCRDSVVGSISSTRYNCCQTSEIQIIMIAKLNSGCVNIREGFQ